MKKKFVIMLIVVISIVIVLVILPLIKIDKNNQIKYISLIEDISKYDEVTCYDDGMSYYKEKDITITNIDIEKKFIFYFYTIDYVKGNLCASEYVLEESYIEKFLEKAVIKENPNNIDIASLIKGKKAIVGNTRYSDNDYEKFIYYTLDGKEEILYVFYVDDLLVIQVGLSDEGAKFIAYK